MENDTEQVKAWETERQRLIGVGAKNRRLFACAVNWMRLLEDGKDLLPYFRERDCRKIGIYGAGDLAEMLIREMNRKKEVEVRWLLDRRADVFREKLGLPVHFPEEYAALEDVDMVVVTAITSFDAISEMLLQVRWEMPVVSLEEIIRKRIGEEYYEQ